MDNTDPLAQVPLTTAPSDQDPLSQLADIHLPADVGLWPLAPGWWVLIALVAAGGFWLGLILFRRWQKQRRLAFALQELEKCFSAYHQSESDNADSSVRKSALVNDVNQVLRRVALLRYPDHQIAGLNGEQWVNFLNGQAEGIEISDEIRYALAQGRFAPRCDIDPAALHAFASQWIRQSYSSSAPVTQHA